MKKQVLSLLLALSLMSVPALAKENSADNFIRGKTYASQFSDLPEGHTFYENVAALYEYGLSVGQTDGTYGLTVPMTVGQSVIFAGRIRSLYRTGDPEAGPAAFTAAAIGLKALPMGVSCSAGKDSPQLSAEAGMAASLDVDRAAGEPRPRIPISVRQGRSSRQKICRRLRMAFLLRMDFH